MRTRYGTWLRESRQAFPTIADEIRTESDALWADPEFKDGRTAEELREYARDHAEDKDASDWRHAEHFHPYCRDELFRLGVLEARPVTRDEALVRWPRLVAHMICESLGYFTPMCAANAVAFDRQGEPYSCEWYAHMCQWRQVGESYDQGIRRIGREVVRSAFTNRRNHNGYMASYQQAKATVQAEINHEGATSGMLASWF
jgi:hypothetical protein